MNLHKIQTQILFFGFILYLFLPKFAIGQSISTEIARYEYQRQGSKLTKLLRHDKPQVRQKALRALARVQDPKTIAAISQKLEDKEHLVRIEAAFALGQTWHSDAEAPLLSALANNDYKSLQQKQFCYQVIEALGKVGTEKTVKVLIASLKKNNFLTEHIGYALGVIAYREVTTKGIAQKLLPYLNHKDPQARAGICYALMRLKDKVANENLQSVLQDPEPEVRINAARALANAPKNIPHLIKALKDKDHRVIVNSLRSLQTLQATSATKAIAELLEHSNHHVKKTAIQVLGNIKATTANKQLHDILNSTNISLVGEALIALAKLEPKATFPKIQARWKTDKWLLKVKLASALGHISTKQSLELLAQTYKEKDIRVVAAAVEAIGRISLTESYVLLLNALEIRDMAVITYAAMGISQSKQRGPQAIIKLIATYKQLKAPVDIEPMDAIIQAIGKLGNKEQVAFLTEVVKGNNRVLALQAASALKKITGKDWQHMVTPNTTFAQIDYKNVGKTITPITANIKTTKGNFVIELFTKDAPITVENFIKLTQKKFYDGLIFHRVVSSFVVQGGDPRGDGWGGPGYAIPCEYNLHRYTRAMVGMPLAGKDTGGCQLFITHSAQPHLNGRYTIFGKVVKGMEIVDKIEEGDIIEKVEIVNK